MGDLVCRECGHANLATANFCSSCGAGLAKDDVANARSWPQLKKLLGR